MDGHNFVTTGIWGGCTGKGACTCTNLFNVFCRPPVAIPSYVTLVASSCTLGHYLLGCTVYNCSKNMNYDEFSDSYRRGQVCLPTDPCNASWKSFLRTSDSTLENHNNNYVVPTSNYLWDNCWVPCWKPCCGKNDKEFKEI